jgi:hypothetical protein
MKFKPNKWFYFCLEKNLKKLSLSIFQNAYSPLKNLF